jgi:tRNA(Arg) A34 adenosine deaminase TadA
MQRALMSRAIDLAIENVNSRRGGPFAAVVARGAAVVAEGTNLVTTALDPTAHAEIVAIRNACRALHDFQLTGCDVYTTCEPCPMCLAAIFWARADRIYYASTREDAAAAGFDDARLYEELALAPGQRSVPAISLMRAEAQAAFDAWQRLVNRVEY